MDTTRMDAPRPAAFAKAQVHSVLIESACRLPRSAQLILQHILAMSYPHPRGWKATVSLSTLAERTGLHYGSVRRMVKTITETMPEVDRVAGDRDQSSEYIIDVRVLWERAGAPPGERAGAPRGSAPARGFGNCGGAPARPNSVIVQNSSSSRERAAAAVAVTSTDQQEHAKVQYLTRRPYWLPEGKPWLGAQTALRLVRMAPWALDADVQVLLQEVKASRLTVEKPAGLFISLWRQMAERGPTCRV